ncbi:MAG: helix-turn-helix domain-containing protein [Bacteroidota bacterium]
MATKKKQSTRRLAAVMFTDIVGYTALMQQDEKEAATARARHREVFNLYHEKHEGEILQYFGDGTLSVFQSGVEAVECALAIQLALNKKQGVPLRIGLHIGDIVFDGTDIYGNGVNLASRIESMGVAGSILLSKKLNDEIKNHPQLKTKSLGLFALKNILEAVEIFAVKNKGINVPLPQEMKGKQKKQNKTLAVLPFINLSPNKENEYFSDGMTEEIINALTKIKGLKVTSRTSSFFFKNKNIPVPQIGKELNVSTILEGSIRLAGNKMRITAQLIDVNDDYHFWSENFDRSIDDVFAVQDEISLLIADRLREHLGHFEIDDKLVEAPDISVSAYQKYLKARFHILKMTKPDIETGMDLISQLIKEQPYFPLAHIGLHFGYTMLGTLGFMPSMEAFTKGQPYLEKAIELKPDLPECQLNLAYMAFLQKWDLESAYQHLNNSFNIRPTVEYYQSMTSVIIAEGNFEAAFNYIETAIQIDPFSEINHHLKGFIFYCSGKYEQAVTQYKKSIQIKPDAQISQLELGQALILSNRIDEAFEVFNNMPGPENDLIKSGGKMLCHAASKNIKAAKKGIAKLEAALQNEQMERAMNILMLCHTILGDHDKALQLFEQGIQFRLPLMVYVPIEPILQPLRKIPRFQELAQQIFGKKTTVPTVFRKYKKALLNQKELNKYKLHLAQLMDEKKPFLNPNLTLRTLAAELNIPANHLSQLLNEGFDKNFSEFVNSYRLESFKSKAADPALQHLTILALAYDSGFNSKTVFNTFFKKTMGMTPRAYWKEIREL